MEYFNAFWVGGLLCAIGQILIDKTKLTPARILVSLRTPEVNFKEAVVPTATSKLCP